MGTLDYPGELPKIHSLTENLINDPDVAHVESWYHDMVDYTYNRTNNGEYIIAVEHQNDQMPFHAQLQTHFSFL